MKVENLTIFVAFLAMGTVFSTDNSEAHDSKGDKNESSGSANQAECQSLGLSGRLAVVTGGASGIGRSVCMVLAREGATVIVADRNRTGSDETIQKLQGRSYPGDHRVIYVDVSNSTAVDVLFEEIATYFPSRKISVVVSSAGIVEAAAPIQDMNDTQFDDTLATNLRGTFLIDRASVRHMLTNNVTDGAIVNIASIIAKTAFPRYSPYSASKGGVVPLTKAVALEVASSGIRVNAMLPGPVDTPLLARLPPEVSSAFIAATAFKRKARPDEISETIAFMCSPKSSFMTGAAIDVTGGIIA
ncbi:unnamed protein product [Ixodes persulcatus]